MITPAAFGSNPSSQRVSSSAVASLRFAPSRSALRSALGSLGGGAKHHLSWWAACAVGASFANWRFQLRAKPLVPAPPTTA
jgi:hypothetical protein